MEEIKKHPLLGSGFRNAEQSIKDVREHHLHYRGTLKSKRSASENKTIAKRRKAAKVASRKANR